jgi:PAS domain S-box-containing protein
VSQSRSPWNRLSRLWYLALVFSAIVYLVAAVDLHAAEPEQVQRVLIVHSFGSTAPPFTTHSTAFATALKQAMGKRVDLDEVSLDMARYAQPDMEETFVEFLRKRLTRWSPDLVVPVGSPAGRFVAKYRELLFPQIPVIYTGMDRRTLPAGPLKNAAFVGESFNLAGLVDDILQLAPDTTHVAVVIGASPLERYWTAEFRRAFEPFANRISFTWFNDLTFEQMLEQVAKLPPRSFILIGLLIRDASGVTHNQEEALQRLRAVANAPINGIFQHELGLGIVGGRLYQAEAEGIESARIAIGVLSGEPVSNFPELVIPPKGPQYDWRELQHWNIPEDRLPTGSVIAFRQPTAWEQYRWYVVGALVVIFIQAGMIFDLLVQRRRRRLVEAELRENEQVMELASSAGGLGLWSRDLVRNEVWANSQLRSLFGVDANESLVFDDLLATIHRDDRANVIEHLQNVQNAGVASECEFRVIHPSGGERWVVARDKAIHGPRGIRRMGTMVDITERKQTEIELREQRAELAHVARISTMGELAASLAHELNQPLTAILSNAQAALRFLSSKPSDIEEVREILQDIVQDNSRASEVIRRMRALVKKEDIEFASLDLAGLIRDVVVLLHSDAILQNIKISLSLAENLTTVLGDKVQLQQVVLNLLLNAFDAMKDCAALEREVKVRAEPYGAALIKVAVSDRGMGLSVDKLDKIFEPFYTTKGEEGLGMGLSICRSIIEAHGGRLWAENNAGAGATFYFTLLVEGEEGRVSREAGRGEHGEPERP